MGNFEKCKWSRSCGHDICLPEFCSEYEAMRMNNADVIRAMSDEELARVISANILTGACNDFDIPGRSPCQHKCEVCVLEWLQQHAE